MGINFSVKKNNDMQEHFFNILLFIFGVRLLRSSFNLYIVVLDISHSLREKALHKFGKKKKK